MRSSRVDAVLSRTVMLALLTLTSAGLLLADEKEEAINADRALLAGEWRVVSVEANGNNSADLALARVTIVNRLDGTWSLLSNGNIIAEGTSTIDPTTKPKTIELKGIRASVENARGTHYRGIYEVHETTRRLCFVPADKPLPESFSGGRDTGQILVTFEKVVFE
jgi:uncharacterized protein (TIGR03067 family)